MNLNERKIVLTEKFNVNEGRELASFTCQDAVTLNGVTLVRCGFGDYRRVTAFMETRSGLGEYDDILRANGHLCQSDLM